MNAEMCLSWWWANDRGYMPKFSTESKRGHNLAAKSSSGHFGTPFLEFHIRIHGTGTSSNIQFEDCEEEQEIQMKSFADAESHEGSEEQSGSEEGTTSVAAACPGVSRDLKSAITKTFARVARVWGDQWDIFHQDLEALPAKESPVQPWYFSAFLCVNEVNGDILRDICSHHPGPGEKHLGTPRRPARIQT